MRCPIAVAWVWALGHKPDFSYSECIENECAWWNEEENCCSFKSAAKDLSLIQRALYQLVGLR